jgi:site-specific DNA recombinase
LKARLLETASGFGKAYLNLVVDEVRLDGSELHIKGSYAALARAITLTKEGKMGEVPRFRTRVGCRTAS